MIIAAGDDDITADDLRQEVTDAAASRSDGTTLQFLKADAERQIIIAALDRNDWQVTRTAEELGLADHASLLKLMRRLGIRKADR